MADAFDMIMFAMAKEFGWTPDQIRQLEYRHFVMYSKQLSEYYKANEAAAKGKKYSADIDMSEEDKEHKKDLLKKWSVNKK